MQQDLDLSIEITNKTQRNPFLDQICFIPQKEETEEEFLKRVNDEFLGGLKRVEHHLKIPKIERLAKILSLLHIDARHLPWVISKKRLAPWHLGVYETDGRKCRIQIHPRALKKKKFDEVLSHEAVHHLRRSFDGPYEELLPYLTSEKLLYRNFGYFLTSMEFKIALVFTFLMSCLTFWIYDPVLQWSGTLIISAAFILCRYRLRAPFKLLKAFQREGISYPLALLIRLNKEEIDLLANEQFPTKKIKSWQMCSFRWKFLSSLYLDERPQNLNE